MASAAEYRLKAAQLQELAQSERRADVRAEQERLAWSYLRLAEQAEQNGSTDIVYETPRRPSDEVG